MINLLMAVKDNDNLKTRAPVIRIVQKVVSMDKERVALRQNITKLEDQINVMAQRAGIIAMEIKDTGSKLQEIPDVIDKEKQIKERNESLDFKEKYDLLLHQVKIAEFKLEDIKEQTKKYNEQRIRCVQAALDGQQQLQRSKRNSDEEWRRYSTLKQKFREYEQFLEEMKQNNESIKANE